MMKALRVLLPISAAAIGTQAFSVTLFYGGDFDGRNGFASERNTVVSDARTYDNFTVGGPGWIIDSMFANCLVSEPLAGATAYYEIRTPISEGNGGTLLFSGTVGATKTATGRSGFGLTEYTFETTGSLGIVLGPGNYHFTVVPIGEGGGRSFVSVTSGANGVGGPLADGKTFLDSPFFGVTFTDWQNLVGAGTWDVSMGIRGSAVPEPASLLLIGTGLAFLAARRKK